MRVLVLHPPIRLGPDFIDYPWVTDLGAVQLAAVLRQAHAVTLLDAFACPGAGVVPLGDGVHRLGASPAQLVAMAAAAPPPDAVVVAITPFHRPPGRDELLGSLLGGLRRLAGDAPMILADCHQGGQHAPAVAPGELLVNYPEIDAWVRHEAEVTVPALIDAMARGAPPPSGAIAGAEADLSVLPPPAWNLLDLAARDRFQDELVSRLRRPEWPFPLDRRTLPAVTSRGCPYDCLHCTSNPGRTPEAPKTQRRLPPARTISLLETLAVAGVRRVWLLDELLNASPAHLDVILTTAERLGLALEVPNGLRADHLRDADLLRLRARLTTLSVSAESGVQRVIDEIVGKRLDLAAVERVAAGCAAAGLPLLIHYIIGLPGETASEANETLAHAGRMEACWGARPAVQRATPLPGSRLAARMGAPPTADDLGAHFQARAEATSTSVPPEHTARLLWAFERRPRPCGPRKLILNLTYRCNNHCEFCAVGNRARRDGDPSAQLEALVRGRRAGASLLDIDGGEPTMHEGLFDLVARARGLGYRRISVTTNGRRCAYPPYARRLATCGVDAVLVSLHGADAFTHGALVGVGEAYDQTVSGLRNLVAAARPGLEVGVNTTVVRRNQDQLEALAALVVGLGVRRIAYQFVTPFGLATRSQAPDVAVAISEVRRVVNRFADTLAVSLVNLPLCQAAGLETLAAPDLGKAERDMVFVNDESVNLGAYLATRRVRRPECVPCAFASCCAGFYELPEMPEDPWTGDLDAGSPARAATISLSPKRAR